MSNSVPKLSGMATASNNGATRATRRATKGNTMSTNTNRGRSEKDQPVDHAPASVFPQPTNVTAYLRDNARYGATLVTRNGVSIVETGHAVKMTDADGRVTAPLFAPTADTLARKFRASVEMPQLD